MAKYKNIKTGEIIEKSNKGEALYYFVEKDKSITFLHIKNVIVLNEVEAIPDKTIIDNNQLLNINKTKEDGKRE